ncbi:MAG TPA: SIR2 family protein [Pirellulales bacterium]|nr:SIR2 family protein [Pirellulales bacterium]
MPTALEQLEQELVTSPNRVVLVAGIGVSSGTCGNQECASWKGLLRHGLQRCQDVCGTDGGVLAAQRAILDNPNAPSHAWISVGQFITDELNARRPGVFGAWLSDSIGGITHVDTRLVRALADLGVNLATTNYDGMIEAGTNWTPITWRDHASAANFFRGSSQDVLHLHGYYRQPDSVVLGARSYGDICSDPFFQTALRGLMIHGTLLFVGCGAGLEDPNFGPLLEWGRTTLANCFHTHFILVRSDEVEAWRERLKGIPIELVPYGATYSDLLPFVTTLADSVRRRRVSTPLSLLSAAQMGFDDRWRRLESEREVLPTSDYFARSRVLAQELWAAGGRHRAALAFSDRVTFQGTDLPIPEYVEFSLDAAEWLLDDGLASFASRHLAEIATKLENADVLDRHQRQFRELRVRCMDALCAYTEVLQAIAEAIPHAGVEERHRLEAERSEIHFLQGNFGQAKVGSEGG